MRIQIFGAAGMLGHKLFQKLSVEHETFPGIRGEFSHVEKFGIFRRETTISGMDVTDDKAVYDSLKLCRPDVVINAAGIVKQRMQSSTEAIRVNSVFPHILAEMAGEFGYRLISISTDCVFSGTRRLYTEDDLPDALDLYGRSKLLGEVAKANCLTIRTSLIGRELFHSAGLLEWFLGSLKTEVSGYTNVIFSGFPTIVFADIISEIIANHPEVSGLLHISGKPISKFNLLQLINDEYKCGVKIVPVGEPRIDRSLDSSKFCQITGFQPLSWPEMIRRMHDDPTPYHLWR